MKLFLRYQLTGAVFIGWFIILYYGGQHSDLQEIIKSISNLKTDHALLSAFVAYPIGVLIHQFSVLLKNMVFAKFHSSLSDAPLVFDSNKICSNKLELAKYYFDKTSNLNTFYYVRFDNAFLSPLLATIAYFFIYGTKCIYNSIILKLLSIALIISITTLFYLFRIVKELEDYNKELKDLNLNQSKLKDSYCPTSPFTLIMIALISIFFILLVISTTLNRLFVFKGVAIF